MTTAAHSTYSVIKMEVIGPKKMVYPERKARNLVADSRIFHWDRLAKGQHLSKRRADWYECPTADDSSKQLTTADIDILGAEGHQIVGRTDRVGRYVNTKGDDEQANGAKGCSSPASVCTRGRPIINNEDGIPLNLAVDGLGSCSSEDTEKADDGCQDVSNRQSAGTIRTD